MASIILVIEYTLINNIFPIIVFKLAADWSLKSIEKIFSCLRKLTKHGLSLINIMAFMAFSSVNELICSNE